MDMTITEVKLSPQCHVVLNHIRKYGHITPLEARNYGIDRLASRIHDLRKAGLEFATNTRKDLFGKRYTRYSLAA